MSLLADRPTDFVAEHQQFRALLEPFGPASLNTLRDAGLAAFTKVGLPTRADEEFKYLPLKPLEAGGFGMAYGATLDRHQLAEHFMGRIDGIAVTFVNGQYAPELSTVHASPHGVFVGTLADGFLSHEQTILQHLGEVSKLDGKLGSTNDPRFIHLNNAFLGEGAFVYVPKGVAFETTIHISYINVADHGPFVVYPRSLIVLEAGATAKVVESYLGRKGVTFTNAVTEIVVGPGANLEHTKYQEDGPDCVHIATVAATQAENSVWTSNNVNFGGKIVRNDVNLWLDGEHTESWLNGVSLGFGEQVVDNHTRIDHAKPNCNSFEVYKAILGDHATGIFNGKIFVYEDAQKTDAKQTNQALLLSPHATINTKPQLEIFADDVKCTHGATVGQLQADALFYLRARGIPLAQARALLVYAFAAEGLAKITIPEVSEGLETLLFQRLALPSQPAGGAAAPSVA